jgi:hypothetical protein
MARGIHYCPNFLKFFLPDRPLYIVTNMCVYIHISDLVETGYELALLSNNTAVKPYYRDRESCELLTRYFLLGRRPGGEWADT